MTQSLDLQRSIKIAYALADRACAKGYIQFLENVVIDASPSPRKFADVAAPFQWERARLTRGPIESVAGFDPHYAGPRGVFTELPRGCDKTGHSARVLLWLLAYSKKRLRMFAFAADQDQAGLQRDALASELKLNPYLGGRVQVLRKFAWGPGGTVEFLASDADSAHGKTGHVIIGDEFSHISGEKGQAFFNAIFSAKEKRQDCVVLLTSNAGFKNSWQWKVREAIRTSPYWIFYASEPGTHPAPWMSMDSIRETGRMMLESEYQRLFLNIWDGGSGDNTFVTRDEVDRCVDLNLKPHLKAERGVKYYCGCDYGIKKDRTAISVLHREQAGRICIDRLEAWNRPGGLVRVEEVDTALDQIISLYPGVKLIVDPFQLESTIQRLEAKRIDVERFAPRGGAANYEAANCLRSHVCNANIAWYPNCGPVTLPRKLDDPSFAIEAFRDDTLESELASLVIRPTSSGYRFDHTSNKHDDRAISIAMSLLAAVADPLPPPPLPPPISVPSQQRELAQLPFAKQRGLFGVAN